MTTTTSDTFRVGNVLRIGVDLDGVLSEHPAPLAHAANEQFQLDLPERAFVDSAGLNVPLEVREWVYSDDGPAANQETSKGAQAFLSSLIDLFGAGNVMIITARPETAAAMTVNWLERHGFPKLPIHFSDDKLSIALREGCQYAVEDSERHARNYAAGGVFCYLIDPTGQAHTRDLVAEKAALAVRNFDEILENLPTTGTAPAVREAITAALPPVDEVDATARPKIVVSDAIHDVARAELTSAGEVVDVDGTDLPALLAAIEDAEALVVRSETQVTAEVLQAAPKLRVIARAGVGVDNIDLDAATRAGVLVINAPGANATSAGEHTIAVLLALTRQIPYANATTHAGEWQRKQLKPIDLRGRTVGIVGLGRVGSLVAERLRAFQMRVIAFDPYIEESRFRELGVEPVDLEAVLTQSDVVTFHVPSSDETRHLINADTIQRLKPGAYVLNVARGEIVDQEALADALRDGRLAGAAVDVFPSEPTRESPLFGLPNAVLTPHTGGSSIEALEAVGRVIGTTTLAALRGETVPNAVNLPPASLEAPALRHLTTVAGAGGHLLSVLSPELPRSIRLTAHGLVPSDVVQHVLGAALSNAFQKWLGRRVTPVNAQMIAREMGVGVEVLHTDQDEETLPQFRFAVSGEAQRTVTVTWDRVFAGIVEIDRFSLQRPLAGHVIITHHHDQPGVIAQMATVLSRHNINIAGMQVGRDAPRGEALMVTNVDDDVSDSAMQEIRECAAVDDAFLVTMPPFDSEPDPMRVSAMAVATASAAK